MFNLQHVPIPPFTHMCDKGCCTATFMPLQIAYAITIHRCQGLEAGFDEGDRWRRVVVDPSDTMWEIAKNIGTMYTSTSRGKSLGSKDETFPQDSSIYWMGCDASVERIRNCKTKRNGQLCDAYVKREKWVTHLKTKAEETKKIYSKRKIDEMTSTSFATAMSGNLIKDRDDLTTRITEIITNPNEKWKKAKLEYQLPPNYYS
eukprot:scaffold9922_cov166-Skeletonema_marinoi.AAC.1